MVRLRADKSQNWYSELGALIATAPDLQPTTLPVAALTWVGRGQALLLEMGMVTFATEFKMAFEFRAGTTLDTHERQAEKMRVVLYQALGVAERSAPAANRGTFIPVSSVHDALIAIAAVLGKASADVLIVDPYMSQVISNDFALSIPEGVTLRLLYGDRKTAPDLEPALRAWRQQRTTRPAEVRTAKQSTLHDRLIVVDGAAWSLSQSFNALAKRSPATLMPFDTDIGHLKAAFYEDLWTSAAVM